MTKNTNGDNKNSVKSNNALGSRAAKYATAAIAAASSFSGAAAQGGARRPTLRPTAAPNTPTPTNSPFSIPEPPLSFPTVQNSTSQAPTAGNSGTFPPSAVNETNVPNLSPTPAPSYIFSNAPTNANSAFATNVPTQSSTGDYPSYLNNSSSPSFQPVMAPAGNYSFMPSVSGVNTDFPTFAPTAEDTETQTFAPTAEENSSQEPTLATTSAPTPATTQSPTTQAPINLTSAPTPATTQSPTTQAPINLTSAPTPATTQSPTTQAPINLTPAPTPATTQAPSNSAVNSVAPTSSLTSSSPSQGNSTSATTSSNSFGETFVTSAESSSVSSVATTVVEGAAIAAGEGVSGSGLIATSPILATSTILSYATTVAFESVLDSLTAPSQDQNQRRLRGSEIPENVNDNDRKLAITIISNVLGLLAGYLVQRKMKKAQSTDVRELAGLINNRADELTEDLVTALEFYFRNPELFKTQNDQNRQVGQKKFTKVLSEKLNEKDSFFEPLAKILYSNESAAKRIYEIAERLDKKSQNNNFDPSLPFYLAVMHSTLKQEQEQQESENGSVNSASDDGSVAASDVGVGLDQPVAEGLRDGILINGVGRHTDLYSEFSEFANRFNIENATTVRDFRDKLEAIITLASNNNNVNNLVNRVNAGNTLTGTALNGNMVNVANRVDQLADVARGVDQENAKKLLEDIEASNNFYLKYKGDSFIKAGNENLGRLFDAIILYRHAQEHPEIFTGVVNAIEQAENDLQQGQAENDLQQVVQNLRQEQRETNLPDLTRTALEQTMLEAGLVPGDEDQKSESEALSEESSVASSVASSEESLVAELNRRLKSRQIQAMNTGDKELSVNGDEEAMESLWRLQDSITATAAVQEIKNTNRKNIRIDSIFDAENSDSKSESDNSRTSYSSSSMGSETAMPADESNLFGEEEELSEIAIRETVRRTMSSRNSNNNNNNNNNSVHTADNKNFTKQRSMTPSNTVQTKEMTKVLGKSGGRDTP